MHKTFIREGVGHSGISTDGVVLDLESVMCYLVTDFKVLL